MTLAADLKVAPLSESIREGRPLRDTIALKHKRKVREDISVTMSKWTA